MKVLSLFDGMACGMIAMQLAGVEKGEPADEELLLKLDNNFCSYGERKEGVD